MRGLTMLRDFGLLSFILPELEEGIGIEQNKAHAFHVWEHILRTVQHAADKEWPLEIRLAALFHDIGKPRTRRFSDEKKEWTFYGHEVVGARMAEKAMERLHFPKKTIEKVVKLVRWHMFFSDTEQISLSAVRRIVSQVGPENIWDLMNVRICDRIGTGRPKENPYRLRKYKAMIEEVMRDPISVGMLKIDGKKIMEVTKMDPGPKVGFILHALLEEVLEDPKLNTSEYLEKKAIELAKLSDEKLRTLGEIARAKKEGEDEKQKQEILKKYGVS
jgi:tRNA nucleotidyltransferase (CCA-adding enzyme)